jgi:hypothetical protein
MKRNIFTLAALLLTPLAGLRAAPHDIMFWRSRTMSNNYGARQGDWKYVHSTEGDAAPGPKQSPRKTCSSTSQTTSASNAISPPNSPQSSRN